MSKVRKKLEELRREQEALSTLFARNEHTIKTLEELVAEGDEKGEDSPKK